MASTCISPTPPTAELTRVEVRSDEATGLGWWSQRLESRGPTWLLGAAVRADPPLVVATTLHVAAGGEPLADLTVEQANGWITVDWRDGAR